MGEQSSQYAAESSCRQRYGPSAEWMINFDIDEYIVPMGNHTNLHDVVRDAYEGSTNILSLRSTRAYPNHAFTEPYFDNKECGHDNNPRCHRKSPNVLFVETYNCYFQSVPKPKWADRARKQLYRPEYVLSHFVHYSTITSTMITTYDEARAKN